MKMVTVVGTRLAPYYQGRQIVEGEAFDATETDAAYFIRCRRAVAAGPATPLFTPEQVSTLIEQINAAVESAPPIVELPAAPVPNENVAEIEAEPPAERVKRQYRRRDMTAEGDAD